MAAAPLSDANVGKLLKAHAEQQGMFKSLTQRAATSERMHQECMEGTRRLEGKVDAVTDQVGELTKLTKSQEVRLEELEASQAEDEGLKGIGRKYGSIARRVFTVTFGLVVGVLGAVGTSHLDHRDRITRLEAKQSAALHAAERHEEAEERQNARAAASRQAVESNVAEILGTIRQIQEENARVKSDVDAAIRDLRVEAARLRRSAP